MDEQKETKEKETTSTISDTTEGDKSETTSLIANANAAAQRLEEANQKQEELIARQEELAARIALGGKSEGGAEQVKEPEISNKEYAQKALRGELNGK